MRTPDMKPSGTQTPAQSEGEVNTSSRRTRWAAANHDAATQDMLDEDARYFLHQAVSTPCLSVITGAEGPYIMDAQGRRYLDFHGNNVHHIGYGHPRLKAAIAKQMDDLPFAPRRFACAPATALAKKLADIAPGDLSKVLFTTGGSDAVEVALKLPAPPPGATRQFHSGIPFMALALAHHRWAVSNCSARQLPVHY